MNGEFLIYLFLLCMEVLVSNCAVFFCSQIKVAELGMTAYVSLLYFARMMFIICFGYLHNGTSALGDGINHPSWAAWLLVIISFMVVIANVNVYRAKSKGALRRFLLRQSHFKVGAHGPFSVQDLVHRNRDA